MKQAIGDGTQAPEELRPLYRLIRAELDSVEAMLREELRSDFPFVDRLVQHGFRLGGKRLRPALVLLSGKVCGPLKPGHGVLATVVELIHTATLIHDDVLDEATLRRHLETVNARWDNEASVLLGDYLFARAMCLAATLDDIYVCRVLAHATKQMCEGELRQVGSRGDYDLAEEEYLGIIGDKTAALCACACRLGAYWAGADEGLQQTLADYGHHLGIAFQITDDVLDVNGNEDLTGKSLGTDLVKQKPTLPVIRLLQEVRGEERSELLGLLARTDGQAREALRPWLERWDAVAYAEETARGYSLRAENALKEVPAGPARQALAHLAEFVVARRQ
jgi:octaprenyl-diphosphate synthase